MKKIQAEPKLVALNLTPVLLAGLAPANLVEVGCFLKVLLTELVMEPELRLQVGLGPSQVSLVLAEVVVAAVLAQALLEQ